MNSLKIKDELPQAVYVRIWCNSWIRSIWQQASTYSLFWSSLPIGWDIDVFDVFVLFSNAFSGKSLEAICSLLWTQFWLSKKHKKKKMRILVESIITSSEKKSLMFLGNFLFHISSKKSNRTTLSNATSSHVTGHSFRHKTLSFTFSFPGFLFWKKS